MQRYSLEGADRTLKPSSFKSQTLNTPAYRNFGGIMSRDKTNVSGAFFKVSAYSS